MRKLKKPSLKLLGASALNLRGVQGFAEEGSYLFNNGSNASLASYLTGEIAKAGSAIGAGLLVGETARRLEEKLNIPECIKGLVPTLALTAGIAFVDSLSGSDFFYSLDKVFGNYVQSLEDVRNLDPRFNFYSLTGAVATAYSAGRFAWNFAKGLWNFACKTGDANEFADRMKQEREAKYKRDNPEFRLEDTGEFARRTE